MIPSRVLPRSLSTSSSLSIRFFSSFVRFSSFSFPRLFSSSTPSAASNQQVTPKPPAPFSIPSATFDLPGYKSLSSTRALVSFVLFKHEKLHGQQLAALKHEALVKAQRFDEWEEFLNYPRIDLTQSFEQLGLDSLDRVEYLVCLEREFDGYTFEDKIYDQVKCPEDLVQVIMYYFSTKPKTKVPEKVSKAFE